MAQNNPIPSNVSDTDFAVFEQLANLKRVDFSKGALPKRGYSEPILEEPRMDDQPSAPYPEYPSAPRTNGRPRSPLRISVGQYPDDMPEYPPQPARAPTGPGYVSPPPPPPAAAQPYVPPGSQYPSHRDPPPFREASSGKRHQSRFAEQVQQQMTHHPRQSQSRLPPPPPPPQPYPRSERRPQYNPQPTAPRGPPAPPPAAYHPFQPQPPPARPQQFDENDLRKMHANYGSSDEDSIRRKKKRLMDEVKELESKGYIFEVRPTLEDPLEDIQDKVDQGHSSLEMKHTITFARENIPNFYGFVEMANNMWGPWLPIQGFTDQFEEKIRENPARYNYVLERLYRKYWRKGSMSPAMEFFMVFILPFFMYAGKQKFFGNGSAAPKPKTQTTSSVAPEPPRQNAPVPEPMNTTPLPPQPQPQQHYQHQQQPPQQYYQMPPPQQQQHNSTRLNPFNVGPSVPPQPPVSGQFFPPPMMSQPPAVAVPTANIAANLNQASYHTAPQPHQAPSSSSRKHLKPPSKLLAFPATQQPLVPQPHHQPPTPLSPPQRPSPPITIRPSVAPQAPPSHSSSIPPPIPVGAFVSHENVGPITVQIPSTPAHPREAASRYESIPSEGRLPPIVEQPEEDEPEL